MSYCERETVQQAVGAPVLPFQEEEDKEKLANNETIIYDSDHMVGTVFLVLFCFFILIQLVSVGFELVTYLHVSQGMCGADEHFCGKVRLVQASAYGIIAGVVQKETSSVTSLVLS